MKDRNSMVAYAGKLTYPSTICRQVSVCVSSSKGGLPVASSKANIPTPQTSTLKSWVSPRTISGARQSKVPQTVYLRLLVQMDHPKSAIFILPPQMSRFQGLMSRWITLRECRQFSPYMSCLTMTDTKFYPNLPYFFSFPQSYPSGACYRIRQMDDWSQKQPKSLRTLTWFSDDCMIISLFTCYVKLLCSIYCRSMRFRATTYSDARSLAKKTSPNLPFPKV